MNILTIDADYISGNYLNKIYNLVGGKPTKYFWEKILDSDGIEHRDIIEDKHNVMFIMKLFANAMKINDNIVFGAHHDSILNHIDIDNETNFNIYNIDHHHDIWYNPNQKHAAEKYGEFNEGNWILPLSDKISKYTWIRNKNSELFNGEISFPYFTYLHTDPELPSMMDKKWDLVYITLSPNYTAKEHWFYFYMMIELYKEIKGVDDVVVDNVRYTPLVENF